MLVGDTAGGQWQPIVPGEALVHFATGSDGEKLLRRSALSTPPDLALLTDLVNGLSERVGVPLRPGRLGSGDWLLVRIATDELVRRTADRLARCRAVARARPEPGDSTTVVVRVAFRDRSPEARILAQSGRPDGKRQVDSLVGRMARRLDIPLKGAASGNELLVEVALDTLTLQLVDRLKKLREIESAQPNYRMGGFGPRPT
jgi:hypothetical protein